MRFSISKLMDCDKIPTGCQIAVLKELYREQLIATQDRWIAQRTKEVIPELQIDPVCDGGPVNWMWSYRCQEQQESSPSVFDALIDFIKAQEEVIEDLERLVGQQRTSSDE